MRWLDAPNSSDRYYYACRITYEDTDVHYFMHEPDFSLFNLREHSFLLILGPYDRGRNVLTSTMVISLRHSLPAETLIAYVFFDYGRRMSTFGFLTSLVSQFAAQRLGQSGALDHLYRDCAFGQDRPTTTSLMAVLRMIIQYSDSVYVVVESLEDCEDPYSVHDLLQEIHSWKIDGMHFIATYQPHNNIMDSFGVLHLPCIDLDSCPGFAIGEFIQGEIGSSCSHQHSSPPYDKFWNDVHSKALVYTMIDGSDAYFGDSRLVNE